MTLAALAFAAGAAALQLQASLPAWEWVWALPFLVLAAFLYPRASILPAFAIGFLWASTMAHWKMADRLAPELEGRDIEVTGVVSSLPARIERGQRFELEVESAAERLPKKLLVAWYQGEDRGEEQAARFVHPGERWLFTLRLRRPHGQ